MIKESTYNAGDTGSILESGRCPGVFLPGKSHGKRSLVGSSPWGCKESDKTQQKHKVHTNQCNSIMAVLIS